MGRRENKGTAKVTGGWLYQTEEASVPVGSPLWAAWLAEHGTFYYEQGSETFTARKEQREGQSYWYAYRKVAGRLYKVYLGAAPGLSQMSAAAHDLGEKVAGRPARGVPQAQQAHTVGVMLMHDQYQQLAALVERQNEREQAEAERDGRAPHLYTIETLAAGMLLNTMERWQI